MRLIILAVIPGLMLLLGCNSSDNRKHVAEPVAYSEQLWTGIAVSSGQRIFVNYPRWSPGKKLSVAEVRDDRTIRAYPNVHWNEWETGLPGKEYFICVQSVYMDQDDHLWILDTGVDVTRGIVPGGAKLIKTEIGNDSIITIYPFDPAVTPPGTYLNDVRIDSKHNYAYITDSGLGAILALDLTTGHCRRLLADHPSTKSENITLTIAGKPWLGPGGQSPQIHSDGIAFDADHGLVYFQALTGRTLYRIPANVLRDTSLSDTEVESQVKVYMKSGPADGLVMDRSGCIYITSIEENAIKKIDNAGKLTTLVSDSLLQWPDSFALWQDNTLYVTTSQIHLGSDRKKPYSIFRIALDD